MTGGGVGPMRGHVIVCGLDSLGIRIVQQLHGFGEPVSVLLSGHDPNLESVLDGWGVPLNEGASMSMALISTNGTGAAHHLIRRGANGFVVQAGSVSSLARAMEMYRANPAMIERHGKASALMFERFLPEVCAADFQTIVQSWLETRSGLR